MSGTMSREQIQESVNQVLRGDLKHLVIPDDGNPPFVSVIPIKTTDGSRPDGLREDVKEDVGFSFAVAEAYIEVDRTQLTDEQFRDIHRILWEAGTDDWMDYSELNHFEPEDVPGRAKLLLSFSSAAKATTVIVKLLAAMGR